MNDGGAIYRFDLVGVSGARMPGYIFGRYTVAQALVWAIDDLASGRAEPFEIIRPSSEGGGVAYDVAQIRAAAQQLARQEVAGRG